MAIVSRGGAAPARRACAILTMARLRVEPVHRAALPAVQLLLPVRHPVELRREVGRALVSV